MIKQDAVIYILVGFLIMATAFLEHYLHYSIWCVIADLVAAMLIFVFSHLTWKCKDEEKARVISLFVCAALLIPVASFAICATPEVVWAGIAFIVFSATIWIFACYMWIEYKKQNGHND